MIAKPNPETNAAMPEPEDTLRLLAALPPPAELTDRVHARIAQATRHSQAAHNAQARRGFWSHWLPAQRLQFAGAAMLAVVVAGSTWSHYHRPPQTRPQPLAPASPSPAGSAFGSANATRVPPTLHPIKVPPAPHRKPGHIAAHTPAPKLPIAAPAASLAGPPSNP